MRWIIRLEPKLSLPPLYRKPISNGMFTHWCIRSSCILVGCGPGRGKSSRWFITCCKQSRPWGLQTSPDGERAYRLFSTQSVDRLSLVRDQPVATTDWTFILKWPERKPALFCHGLKYKTGGRRGRVFEVDGEERAWEKDTNNHSNTRAFRGPVFFCAS